ncbi:hypothetical protein TSUD_192690 [Trifolium subterraneum]|uniref:Uncharacterized protein n=1 Tax=Trifolium subterraneum TaxID=3900 RepID=A0A2Z6M3H7_TRISU|nr:hypothetical protein TSUD_192690 [Trifolium subterraneum]
MQQYQAVVTQQYGENERCNRNNLFRVQVDIGKWSFADINDEISSKTEHGEFVQVKRELKSGRQLKWEEWRLG